MLHPSYSDLIQVVNSEVEPGEAKVVNSRQSIVMAIAKRARQIIDGDEPLVYASVDKPLSIAVEELNKGEIKILSEEEQKCYFSDLSQREGFSQRKPSIAAPKCTESTFCVHREACYWSRVNSNRN